MALVLSNLGDVARDQGDYEQAGSAHEESLDLLQSINEADFPRIGKVSA